MGLIFVKVIFIFLLSADIPVNHLSPHASLPVTFWGKDEKLLELQDPRDLFGQLMYISMQEDIDLAKVFTYP